MVALENSRLLKNSSHAERRVIQAAAREQSYDAGEVIFSEGDPGTGLFIVKDGRVQISARVTPKENQVLGRVQPGDFFGEMAVLDGQRRSASATADGPVTLYFITNSDFWDAIEQAPTLARRLMREFSLRVRDFDRQFLEQALQSERLAIVGRFAGTIIHDLKNPLSTIGLAVQLLAADPPSAEKRQTYIGRMRRQLTRMNTMIGELLEFTRSGKADPELEPTNCADYFNEFLSEAAEDAKGSGIEIVVKNPPPNAPLFLNPQRFSHALHNLIGNASDVLPDGGKIMFEFRTHGRELEIQVEDTGPGIAPEIAETLFEPFVTHGKTRGTGLGLAIVKRIIEDQRGHICVRQEPGCGAIFLIRLPMVSAPGKP